MKIERLISVFDKNNESLVKEINIDFIDLESLKDIFKPNDDDPNLFSVYKISEVEANKLSKLTALDFDFLRCFYQLDCFTR